MKVFLNEHELEGFDETPATVGETLEQLRDEITHAGKLITAIAVDGKLLDKENEREKAWNKSQTETERIDLTVEEPMELLSKGLSNTCEFLKSLRNDFIATAKAFRLGDEVTANNDLAQCLDDLKLALTGMNAAAKLPGVQIETEPLHEALDSSRTHLQPVLDAMYKSQAADDYVSIADSLEYDLTEITDQWINVLKYVLHNVETEMNAVAQEV